jgi:hypothetical protein
MRKDCVIFRQYEKQHELILIDNTAEGRGHRVVAQFAKGEIAKLARSIPEWAQKPFGKEFTKRLALEQRVHERAR